MTGTVLAEEGMWRDVDEGKHEVLGVLADLYSDRGDMTGEECLRWVVDWGRKPYLVWEGGGRYWHWDNYTEWRANPSNIPRELWNHLNLRILWEDNKGGSKGGDEKLSTMYRAVVGAWKSTRVGGWRP